MKKLLFAFVMLCSLVVVAQEGKIKFAVLADTHVGSYASATQDLRDAIADINSQSDIDFIIIAGDITEFGTDEEIMAVKKELEANKKLNADYIKQLESAKEEVVKPFEYADKINEINEELTKLNAELDLGKQETPLVLDDEELQKEIAPIEEEKEQEDYEDEDEETTDLNQKIEYEM